MKIRKPFPILVLAGALAGCPAQHPGTPHSSADSTTELGARIYSGNCVICAPGLEEAVWRLLNTA